MIGVHVEIANICSLLFFFQEMVAALVSLREGSFIFFLRCVYRRVVPYATSGHISMSVSLVYMHSGWYLTQ